MAKKTKREKATWNEIKKKKNTTVQTTQTEIEHIWNLTDWEKSSSSFYTPFNWIRDQVKRTFLCHLLLPSGDEI